MVNKLLIIIVLLIGAPALGSVLPEPVESWVAPGRLFAVKVPRNWQVVLTDDPYTIQFAPQLGGDASLWIRRIEVPPGAHPRQLAMNAVEKRLSKKPAFKTLNQRMVSISGHKAVSVLGTYSHQGNIQFPRAVEEIFLVVGTEAFVFHFECFEPMAARYAPQLNSFYQSFVPRPGGVHGNPFDTREDGTFPWTDKVDF